MLFSRSAEPAHRTLGGEHAVNDFPTIQDSSNRSNSSKWHVHIHIYVYSQNYIHMISHGLLVEILRRQHMLSLRSTKRANRTHGGEQTVIMTLKPSGAPWTFLVSSSETCHSIRSVSETHRYIYTICWLSTIRREHMLSQRVARNQHTIHATLDAHLRYEHTVIATPKSSRTLRFLVIHQVRRLIAWGESQVLIRNSDGNITRYASSALCGDSICSSRV